MGVCRLVGSTPAIFVRLLPTQEVEALQTSAFAFLDRVADKHRPEPQLRVVWIETADVVKGFALGDHDIKSGDDTTGHSQYKKAQDSCALQRNGGTLLPATEALIREDSALPAVVPAAGVQLCKPLHMLGANQLRFAHAGTHRPSTVVADILIHLGTWPRRQRKNGTAFRITGPLLPSVRCRSLPKRRVCRKLKKIERFTEFSQGPLDRVSIQTGIEQAVEPVGRTGTPKKQATIQAIERKEPDEPLLVPERKKDALSVIVMPPPGKKPCRALERRGTRVPSPEVPPCFFQAIGLLQKLYPHCLHGVPAYFVRKNPHNSHSGGLFAVSAR